jgi:hypothetical protein
MDPILPTATGMDARFDAELKAAIPGWRSEYEIAEEERKRKEAAKTERPTDAEIP